MSGDVTTATVVVVSLAVMVSALSQRLVMLIRGDSRELSSRVDRVLDFVAIICGTYMTGVTVDEVVTSGSSSLGWFDWVVVGVIVAIPVLGGVCVVLVNRCRDGR